MILSFGGLFYWLEKIKEIEDILFINDFKVINVEVVVNVLVVFENIFWIVGGKVKDSDFEVFSFYINRVKKVYVFGEL